MHRICVIPQVSTELLPLGSICLFIPEENLLLWLGEVAIFMGIYILPSIISLVCSTLTTMKIVHRAYAKWRFEAFHTSFHQNSFHLTSSHDHREEPAPSIGLSTRELSVHITYIYRPKIVGQYRVHVRTCVSLSTIF